ncbi:MAG: tetratricopeptide repeat protein [Proteobacteria bacterium]|nr:tetratricopeptide repeat protein [Pseudomonadota bacterium]
MGDLFREIDEELRQDRYERLWQSYGKYVLGFGIALVASVIGWKAWTHYTVSQHQAQSLQFSNAGRLLDQGNKAEAAALFANLAERSSGGYRALSRFHQAALRADSGDATGAVSLYEELVRDKSLDRIFREAAEIFVVMVQIDDPKSDAAALQARLEPLMKANGAWRHAARELSGLLALRSGDGTAARGYFRQIADDLEAPQGMRARSVQVLAVIDK